MINLGNRLAPFAHINGLQCVPFYIYSAVLYSLLHQSSQIAKTYEQLSLAVDRHATRIWIVNVGDLKPYELGIDFFISYGWNATRWNRDNLDNYVSLWAQREFDLGKADADSVSSIIGTLTRFNARKKPELLNGTVYSLTDYRE